MLWLEENKLTNLPESITDLNNLQKLDLSYNQFQIFPESINNFTNLKKLYLYENQFTKEEKDRIERLLPNTYIDFIGEEEEE